MKGGVSGAKIPSTARDQDVAKRLWELSATLTKVEWPTNGFNMVGVKENGDGVDDAGKSS